MLFLALKRNQKVRYYHLNLCHEIIDFTRDFSDLLMLLYVLAKTSQSAFKQLLRFYPDVS